jgi:chromosome segregation and condensation protein ScpB/DNA-binding XRE family transcriptional regulator
MARSAPSPTSVAVELRRRRELLGISQAAAARRSGVSRTVIWEIEAGTRVPSVRTYEKLRAGLGLVAPSSVLIPRREPLALNEKEMARLAACVVIGRSVLLSDLAAATATSIPAVREGLLAIASRLAAVGLVAADDGVQVEVAPLRFTEQAVAAIAGIDRLGEVTDEQVGIIALVAYLGTATRRQIEERRGEDSETLLRRLVARDLLEKVPDERAPGGPNVYRVTTRALAALAHPTLESLQGYLGQVVDAGRVGLRAAISAAG